MKYIFLFNYAKIKIFFRKSLVYQCNTRIFTILDNCFKCRLRYVFPKLGNSVKCWNFERRDYFCKIIIENVSYFFMIRFSLHIVFWCYCPSRFRFIWNWQFQGFPELFIILISLISRTAISFFFTFPDKSSPIICSCFVYADLLSIVGRFK